MRHWVQSVENGGALVVLEDGSRWEVRAIDRIHTMLWLPVDDVEVRMAPSPIGQYEFELTHVQDGETVLARYVGP